VDMSGVEKWGSEKGLKSTHPTLLVPYLIEEADGKETCPLEMERAVILCLSEAKRKKPGILTGRAERISCISKLHYPLWGVPWNGRCIVVDGLDMLSSRIKHNVIPEVLMFIEDLDRSSSSFTLFLEVLKRHSGTFRRFASSRESHLKGIVSESLILESLSKVLDEAERIGDDENRAVFVPPIISMEKAEERAQEFIGQWNLLNSEVDALHYAVEVLGEKTEHHKEKISAEIDEIRRDYDSRISRTKSLVDRKVKSLIKEKNKTESKIEKASKRRFERLLKERDRLKLKGDRLKVSLREAENRRKRQVHRYPKRSTTRIDNTIAKYRGEIQVLEKKISEIAKMEANIRRETRKRLEETEEKYQALIAEELEKLKILEEARKLEISEKSEIISRIDQASSSIESQLRELIAGKIKEMDELENMAVPTEIEETSLIGIPFYLVIFESQRRERAEIYPPMVVGSSTGTMQKVRRMFFSFSLESRMRLMLNPRFPELNREIFLNLERKVKSSRGFRELIFERARANNLLGSPDFMHSVAEGIKELEREGWINHNEGRSIMEMYVKS